MKRKQFIFSFILLLMNLFYATAQDKLYSNTFSLRDVELLDGPFRHACNLNVQILLKYDTDRLLAPFLKEAGLPPKGESFPNWIGLDGHVGGHYLSALAIHYVATGNLECKKRIYWQSMPQKEFEHYLAIKQKEELLKIQIDQRTIDVVIAGEQQPEADHFMKNENSRTGNLERESWRDARNKGYFQYKLKTEGNENLSLMVRYWGRETGYRTFDILIDGVKFLTENVSKKWNKGSFINVEYPIPAEMLKNKQYINITFQSRENSIAGRVAAVRLLHTK